MDVVLVAAREEVIDDEVVDNVDAETELTVQDLQTPSEPEDEIRLGSSLPAYRARADEYDFDITSMRLSMS